LRRARRRLPTSRPVDGIARQVASRLFNDLSDLNADPKDDSAILRHAGIALDRRILDFDDASDRDRGVDVCSEFVGFGERGASAAAEHCAPGRHAFVRTPLS
jgi:hypothetical protein